MAIGTHHKKGTSRGIILAIICLAFPCGVFAADADLSAAQVIEETGVSGGLVVHLGCGDGKLIAALGAADGYLVQGLDVDQENVDRARRHVKSRGLYGRVTADRLVGTRLPYIDNLVNLVVAEDLGRATQQEVMRVLCPEGTAYVKKDGQWTKTVKPRPEEIDEWTHYLHDSSNNAVAHDTVVGPPRRMQWLGSPRYSRHHDRMSSMSAAVSSGGRVFYIFDESPPFSILTPAKWMLIARDAFNGTVLWKRSIDHWHTHLWPLKSGPAQLPRRLVASGDRVYVTLSLDGPLTALDAASGETVWTCDKTKATEEVILTEGLLLALANDAAEKPDYDGNQRFAKGYGAKFWDEAPRRLVAVSAETGEDLWSIPQTVLPGTLAADSGRVVFHDGKQVVCLDRDTGSERWRSAPIERSEEIRSFYVPILVLYEDVVLFSGGETAGLQTGTWYTSGKDTLTALSAETGKELWSAYHPPSGYRSPEDLLVANGLVWTGETTSGRAVGVFSGRDPRTGEVQQEFPPDVDIYWFHHRCYRGKATDNYLLMSRAGTEFIDVREEKWNVNHWVRGACSYGVMPANGLLYAPQHPCACYLESKLYGFNALAPAPAGPRIVTDPSGDVSFEKGPAFRETISAEPYDEDWPTYRHDAARSGHAGTSLATAVEQTWRTELGGKLTAPVIARGKVFVASTDTHTVHAVDATTGKPVWQYMAGGRIDSPPTIYLGRVLFGSADGWVYCLRATDGALAWRRRAAPMDQRMTSFEQIESVWPVPGSVLIEKGALYCVAGRSIFVDGGLRLLRLDPKTGDVLSATVLDDSAAAEGEGVQSYVSWLNMPAALPDVLSSDGRLVYMRSQAFDLEGTRLPLEAMPIGSDADRGAPPATQRADESHLFCPTGFLDDTWWHRTYWMYGSRFVSGWCGYYLSGKAAPAGRIMVFDDSTAYGFGRKPQYYRWTTPIEHQLFAADKMPPAADQPAEAAAKESRVVIRGSKSLNPAGKPIAVEAWIKAEPSGGVVLARGGGAHGYVLYVKGGRACFAVRAGGELATVFGKKKVVGKWCHVTGALTAQKELQIHVDGMLDASATTDVFVTANPAEAMEIGADEGSKVGDYLGRFGFSGLIDEVKVSLGTGDETKVVLSMSFDEGSGADASGSRNNGTVEGAVEAEGKRGQALRFTGGSSRPKGYLVNHHWTTDLPLFARAMLLADGKLFIAGPADTIDEEEAVKKATDPDVRRELQAQSDAFIGGKGAVLWTISTADGSKLAGQELDAAPVFDGMAAAAGRLYMSTQDGAVRCFEPQVGHH